MAEMCYSARHNSPNVRLRKQALLQGMILFPRGYRMRKRRTLTAILSGVAFLTLVSSVRADVVHADMYLEKQIFAERHNLTVFDIQSAESGYLYTGHFENNNGKHLGFSMAAVNRGPRLGIVKPQAPSVSQNPEPATMVLLGTGLTAVAALARRKGRRRKL
jgi:hypothetical protein